MSDEKDDKKEHDAIDKLLDYGESLCDEVIQEHEEECGLHKIATGLKQECQGLRLENARSRSGPAMVSSRAYRSGWETLFGSKVKKGDA